MKSFALALVTGTVLVSAAALAQVGAAYGAREPAQCADRKAPAQGALSNERAVEILRCTVEGIGDGDLYLVSDVKITVGQGRALDPRNDYFDDPDPNGMIYPITGSLTRYNCTPVSDRNPEGKSCTSFVEANAKGACYKMRSGDWACRMSDLVQQRAAGVAPPAN
jgi:hypothetical protein